MDNTAKIVVAALIVIVVYALIMINLKRGHGEPHPYLKDKEDRRATQEWDPSEDQPEPGYFF